MVGLFAAPTAIDNVWHLATQPDHLPIVLMLIIFAVFTGVALRQALAHDRLIKAGRKKEILERMRE